MLLHGLSKIFAALLIGVQIVVVFCLVAIALLKISAESPLFASFMVALAIDAGLFLALVLWATRLGVRLVALTLTITGIVYFGFMHQGIWRLGLQMNYGKEMLVASIIGLIVGYPMAKLGMHRE